MIANMEILFIFVLKGIVSTTAATADDSNELDARVFASQLHTVFD